jgi:Ca2+-binding RTX toxin-like protein
VATQVGTPGRDVLRGGDGVDVLVGLGGNDVIFGHNGDDILCGGPGNDVLRGYWDNDTLFGGPGNDLLGGGGWGDHLSGGPGDDFLKGGRRNQWICPDIAYFAPDGGPIVVNHYTSTVTGQGTDRYKDLNAIQGTTAEDVWIGPMYRPHFHPDPDDDGHQ